MSKSKSFFILSRSGCLLPFLITFNLFFGWMFFRMGHWLLIEAILILLVVLNAVFLTKKIFSDSPRRDDVIDIRGQVVDDKKHLE